MILALRGPAWLYGLDTIVQFVVAIVAVIVCYYGYKAYKISKNKKFLYFSSAFALLAFNLFIFAILIPALFVYYKFYSTIDPGRLVYLFRILDLVYMFAILMAYTLFVFIYANIKRKGIKILLTGLVLALVIHSFVTASLLSFNLIAVLLLSFIIFYTSKNWLKKKNINSFLVFLIFVLIQVGHVLFILSLYFNKFYLFAHLTQLIGYSSLFILFMRINYGRTSRKIPNNK